ncbi:hypothetical protein ETD86_01330 [Nonomuraea turkmeniaca]|uniref:DUF3800 domain-containing protein n=1 Tax=Nonomuraea turkmeniaca TaxID=103838 RepID=A0A5S4FX47_9ACTN|nr:hypothetical protein [Nonomuraea turkmeniaca]TMR25266.1 hypothetical protein ETD86_01330 [Nonomuraea turkmeniaca]
MSQSAGVQGPLEIACDESGAEGEKLVGGNTDVFAHASVLMDLAAAEECIRELRARAPSPATQYKAGHILREKHRAALRWLLSPSGPVLGHVHVYLTDKTFLVVGKVVGLTTEEAAQGPGLNLSPEARDMAVALYREGPRAFGAGRWAAFLDAFNYLLRAKNGQGIAVTVDDVFLLVDELRRAGGRAGEIMELLWAARPRVAAFRARLLADLQAFPSLDPLIPGIRQAVGHWGRGGRSVSVVHDRQTTLTDERIAELRRLLPGLAGVRLVESYLDARVQVADVLAGAARKLASDELNGRGDPALTALLRPYVDEDSIWGEDRSWALLNPPDAVMSW